MAESGISAEKILSFYEKDTIVRNAICNSRTCLKCLKDWDINYISVPISLKKRRWDLFCAKILFVNFNPQAPVAQKTADEVVFRHFQGEGVEFFRIGPH